MPDTKFKNLYNAHLQEQNLYKYMKHLVKEYISLSRTIMHAQLLATD